MSNDNLLQKKTAIEQRFEYTTKLRQERQTELQELDDELKRLQGEYRLIEELAKTATPAPTTPKTRLRKMPVEPDAES